MSLASLSVKRPVTVTMVFLLCVMAGVIAWYKLPRELFPSLTFPQLTIVTAYQNAAPEEIEHMITKVVEEAIGTVKNLKRITSVSKEGASLVTAEFSWNTDMNFASLWVREKLDQVKERLPPEADEPLVLAFNPFSEPVVILSVTADSLGGYDLLYVCKKIIKDRLEKTTGVAAVEISGGEEKEIVVDVDQSRLQAAQLSLPGIVDAIRETNVNYPAGTTNEQVMEYLVRTIGEYNSLDDIGKTVIETAEHQSRKYMFKDADRSAESINKKSRQTIKLSELASVSWRVKERTSFSRADGKDNISLAVRKRAEADTISVSRSIRRTVNDLAVALKPHGVHIGMVYDQAVFIKKSISGLIINAIAGGLCAFLVIYYFLRSVRMSLIVGVSIPVSVCISLSLMQLFGLTVNIMSLGGLALGVGMLVDNAIVVVENISRHIGSGRDMKQAAITGADEVSGAILSSTLTTVAVFLPLIFVIGIAGQVFRELSLTIIFSLSASLAVALTLIPRLCSTLGRDALTDRSGVFGKKPQVFQLLEQLIILAMKHRKAFLLAIIGIFAVSCAVIPFMNRNFLPSVDEGQFLIRIDLPVGTRLEHTDKTAKAVEKQVTRLSAVKSVMSQVGSSSEKEIETLGSHQAQLVVSLHRTGSNRLSTQKVIERLQKEFCIQDFGKAAVTFVKKDSLFKSVGEQSSPIALEIQGNDMGILADTASRIRKDLEGMHGIAAVRDDRPLSAPETRIQVDKDKASVSRLSVADIARTGLIGIKGVVAGSFKQEGIEYDIRVRLSEKDRKDITSLENLLIHSPSGYNLYLKQLATIAEGKGPSRIRRIDQERTMTVRADLAGTTLKKAMKKITPMLVSYTGKPGFTVSLSGETEKIRESFTSLVFALILAVILVYMIMAAQFESFLQPFLILCTIPLALIGVVGSLLITGTGISAISMMGFIILGGIVVNNGIVLIDFINQQKTQGMPVVDAVAASCRARIRPIMMTMLTTVLGLLPFVLGLGEGAELRTPMAITVMGGLLFSAVLTLGVIPVLYILVEKKS